MVLARLSLCRFFLLSILPLAGCGYHSAGVATHIPAAARVIDVPVFKNHTQAYHVELTMTEAVLKELQSRTAFKTIATDDPGNADAVLHGDITGFSVYALTYDSTTNQSSSYEVTVTARVRLNDRNGRLLYQNNSYVFRQQYESTQDLVSFIQEDPAALRRLSRDFAQNLVADMTESF
jgi:outer membrane lipopolysaccharide assembly protein LptE/RlpB